MDDQELQALRREITGSPMFPQTESEARIRRMRGRHYAGHRKVHRRRSR